MKVTFILPGVGRKPGEPYIRLWQMEPLGIAYLAGLTPAGVDREFYDDRLEQIDYGTDTDLVAISVETFTAKRSYSIAERFRKRGVPVVLGGYHPTLMSEEASMHADAVVVGEAEPVWEDLLRDAEAGRLKKFYQAGRGWELRHLKVDRSIFAGKDYVPVSLVEAGRGCRFSCNFCSITSFYRQTYRPRSLDEVAGEIAGLDRKTVFLVDDNIVADHSAAIALFTEISRLGIRWIGQGTLDIARDEKMLSLMSRSGCIGLLIGLESLERGNLGQMGKSLNLSIGDYSESIKRIRSFGINLYGTFVFGYDHDLPDSFDRAVDFAIENKFFFAAFNHLVPFPGTPVYSELESQGRLLHDRWWLAGDCSFGDVVFRPANMTPGELSERCLASRKRFYRMSSILRRLADSKLRHPSIAAPFLWYNIISGREVSVRQGMPIGKGMDGEYDG